MKDATKDDIKDALNDDRISRAPIFLLAVLLTALLPLSVGPSPAVAAGEQPTFAFGEKSKQSAGEIDLKDPMTAKARFQPSAVEAGGTVELFIEMTLSENYHAYLDRLKLTIEKPDDLKLAPFKVTPLVQFFDPASKSQKTGVEGKSLLKAVVEVPTGFKVGPHKVALKLVYQACTSEHCLFPKTLQLEAPLAVASGMDDVLKTNNAAGPSVTVGAKPTTPASGSENRFETALKESLFSAFLLVFGVGFLTCLTPCIYPMIPITLAVLGARAHGQSHWKNFSIALVYVLGIAFTYAILGLIAASTGGFFGSALGNIWVVTGLALVFFTMGLSMLGLFEVQAPAFVRNRLGAARTSKGYGGAFATGLLAGIVASPCIGPVLVSILAFIAQTQSQVLGFFMLFTFAVGMGIPFIVLGLSSSALTRLPKAGPWMEIIKIFFGIVMIGMAFFYIRPLYPTWLFHFLLGSACVLVANIFGLFTPRQEKAGLQLKRFALFVVFVVGGAVMILGVAERFQLFGVSALLGDSAAKKHSKLAWKPYSKAEFELAKQKGLPILLDFTAEWCGACQEMEEKTFVDDRIFEVSKNYALLQIDGTADSPQLHEILSEFKVQGFPTYLFYDRKGENRADLTALGFVPADEFLRRMQLLL